MCPTNFDERKGWNSFGVKMVNLKEEARFQENDKGIGEWKKEEEEEEEEGEEGE